MKKIWFWRHLCISKLIRYYSQYYRACQEYFTGSWDNVRLGTVLRAIFYEVPKDDLGACGDARLT